MDPTGRVDEAEVGQIDLGIAARNAAAVYAVGVAVACELNVAASVLGGLAVQPTAPIKSITLNLASCSATVVKSQRCQDFHKEVDHWKGVLGGFPGGASCSQNFTKPENQERLAAWLAMLRARLQEREECSQYDPKSGGPPRCHRSSVEEHHQV